MDIRYIIVILLVLINGYIIYNNNKIEHFENALDKSVTFAVNTYYKADIDSLRNFASISNKILNIDSFILPATDTIMKNVTVLNNTNVKNDLIINKTLVVDGDVTFTNRNSTAYLDILPKFTIIGWNLEVTDTIKPPKGWAVCDGKKYSLDENNYAFKDDYYGIETPDLRGRYILGAGKGVVKNEDGDIISYLTERNDDEIGGDETHTLLEAELPIHSHTIKGMSISSNGGGAFNHNWRYRAASNKPQHYALQQGYTEITGNNQPHNNMPPYYALVYIIKLL